MYCVKCGTKLNNGDLFCPNCGTKVGELKRVNLQENKLTQTIDHISNEAGRVIDDAVSGMAQTATESVDDAARELKKAFQSIDTQEYQDDLGIGDGTDDSVQGGIPQIEPVEKLLPYLLLGVGAIGFVLLIPFVLNLFNSFFGFYFIYSVKNLVSWVILLAALVILAGMIYLFLRRPENDRILPLVGAGTSLLTIFGAISFLRGGNSFITSVLVLASAILGLDLFINVFIEKKELHGPFNLMDDIALLKDMFVSSNEVDSRQYTDANIPQYELTDTHELRDSFFDGTGGELFVRTLLLVLISLVTCGLGMPWALVNILQWKKSHTVIEGRRQIFNGTATQLFGLWIKWYLLTLITCGIYGFFAYVDYQKWVARHTSYEGMPQVGSEPFPYSYFDGNTAEYIGYSIIAYLVNGITCGLAFPWMETMINKWFYKSTVTENERYFYDGTGGGLFGTFIVIWVLTIVTCGLYSPWGTCRLYRYIYNHVHVDALRSPRYE